MRSAVPCLLFCLMPWSLAVAGTLAVTPEQAARLGIHTVPVQKADAQPVVSVLGHVAPAPDSRRPVPAPFAGTVERLLKLEGDAVRKGDALALLVSSDMQAGEARLRGLEARSRAAEAAAERARLLVQEGIAPASRAEEAQAEAASVAADLAAARHTMALAVAGEGGSYRLLAPADGRVSAIAVSAGDQVSAMQPILNIDTRDELWVEGTLPAAAIGLVAPGDSVVLEGQPGVTGTVVAAGTSIDPRTRGAMVRARLAASPVLVSGQTVRLAIRRKAVADSFNVPRAAVVQMKKGPVVFAARPGGFEPVPVRILARGARDATIQGALSARDAIAASGVTELKAASLED